MKKLCFLLAIITLLSCCLMGCSKEEAPAEQPTAIPEQSYEVEEKQMDILRLKELAQREASRLLKEGLANPSSYQEHKISHFGGIYKYKGWIYFEFTIDYSYMNSSGGYNRSNALKELACKAECLDGSYYDTVVFYTPGIIAPYLDIYNAEYLW